MKGISILIPSSVRSSKVVPNRVEVQSSSSTVNYCSNSSTDGAGTVSKLAAWQHPERTPRDNAPLTAATHTPPTPRKKTAAPKFSMSMRVATVGIEPATEDDDDFEIDVIELENSSHLTHHLGVEAEASSARQSAPAAAGGGGPPACDWDTGAEETTVVEEVVENSVLHYNDGVPVKVSEGGYPVLRRQGAMRPRHLRL
jgi:hypothetical protein